MKKFIAILALVLSTVAAAESTLIFEHEDYWGYRVYPEFEVNKQLGRAWVNVELARDAGDSTDFYDNRVKIEGLSYNAETKEIIIERDGEQIVCGTIYNRRWVIDIGGTVRNSGRCTFSVKKTKKIVDDGFETHKVPTLQVYLNVQ